MEITEALEIAGQEWVALADLRAITGMSPGEFADAVIKARQARKIRLEPQPHSHRLTEVDHNEAVRYAGSDNHLAALI